jgi:hypothetical protein
MSRSASEGRGAATTGRRERVTRSASWSSLEQRVLRRVYVRRVPRGEQKL